jgi:hypothetical protein
MSDKTRGASVYTSGLSGVTTAVTVGSGKQAASFPTDGGNVVIAAGGNVVGAPFLNAALDGGDFSVTGWQPHGLTTVATATGTQRVGAYGVNFDAFDWNVGALGGGDLTVSAGGKVSNLSAATAASSLGWECHSLWRRRRTANQCGGRHRFRPDLCGRRCRNAEHQFWTDIEPYRLSHRSSAVGSSFALGNSAISVWARQSILVDAAYNPYFGGSTRESRYRSEQRILHVWGGFRAQFDQH